jgi:hypothetical protein
LLKGENVSFNQNFHQKSIEWKITRKWN